MDIRQVRLIRWLLRWVCDRKGHRYEVRIETIEGRDFEIKECKRCGFTITPNGFWSWMITASMKRQGPKMKAAFNDPNPLFERLTRGGKG